MVGHSGVKYALRWHTFSFMQATSSEKASQVVKSPKYTPGPTSSGFSGDAQTAAVVWTHIFSVAVPNPVMLPAGTRLGIQHAPVGAVVVVVSVVLSVVVVVSVVTGTMPSVISDGVELDVHGISKS